MRRATSGWTDGGQTRTNFYPRSPCGERPLRGCPVWSPRPYFYPRSPCGERQRRCCTDTTSLNFYPRSPCGERPRPIYRAARPDRNSIHALLAESDWQGGTTGNDSWDFYPRSPCGERPIVFAKKDKQIIFLSTLSLRRATNSRTNHIKRHKISIHALLAESDATC